MDIVLGALALGALAASLFAYVYVVSWTVNDARARGWEGPVVLLIFWLCGLAAVPLWFLIRPRHKLIDLQHAEFESAEDALAVASMLDSRGEWDGALAIYNSAEVRWPEHASYIQKCKAAINDRIVMSQKDRP
jgi:hypothetical protein